MRHMVQDDTCLKHLAAKVVQVKWPIKLEVCNRCVEYWHELEHMCPMGCLIVHAFWQQVSAGLHWNDQYSQKRLARSCNNSCSLISFRDVSIYTTEDSLHLSKEFSDRPSSTEYQKCTQKKKIRGVLLG